MYTPLLFMPGAYPRKQSLLCYTHLFPYGIIIAIFH